MNHYTSKNGTRYSQSQVDRKIREAKEVYSQNFLDTHGYFFCEECGRNISVGRIDRSHIIPVGWLKGNGYVDLCWHPGVLRLLCREDHLRTEAALPIRKHMDIFQYDMDWIKDVCPEYYKYLTS